MFGISFQQISLVNYAIAMYSIHSMPCVSQ